MIRPEVCGVQMPVTTTTASAAPPPRSIYLCMKPKPCPDHIDPATPENTEPEVTL